MINITPEGLNEEYNEIYGNGLLCFKCDGTGYLDDIMFGCHYCSGKGVPPIPITELNAV